MKNHQGCEATVHSVTEMSVSAYKMHITHPRLDFDLRQKKAFNIYPFINLFNKNNNTSKYQWLQLRWKLFAGFLLASGLLIVV